MKMSYELFLNYMNPQNNAEKEEAKTLMTTLEGFNGNFDSGILLTDIIDCSIKKERYPLIFETYKTLKKLVKPLPESLDYLQTNSVLVLVSLDKLQDHASYAASIETILVALGLVKEACQVGLYTMLFTSYVLDNSSNKEELYGILEDAARARGVDIEDLSSMEAIYNHSYQNTPGCQTAAVAQAYLTGGREAEMKKLEEFDPLLKATLNMAIWNQSAELK
jgi:hypothetical protein